MSVLRYHNHHILALKDIFTLILYVCFGIGNGNRDHETSSKRGRLERFTTYRKTSNNVPPLIIPAPLKFQKKVSSTSNNSRPLIIPATISRGNRLTVRKNNRLN